LFRTLLFATAINATRVGCQLVFSAWLAVHLTQDPGSVSVLLIMSSVLAFGLSRPIGRWISQSASKKRVIWSSHFMMSGVALLPILVGSLMDASQQFWLLSSVCAMTTTLGLAASGGNDYFLKQLDGNGALGQRIASLSSVSQVSLVIGTGIGGFALTQAAFPILFVGLAALSGCSGLWIFLRLPPEDNLPVAQSSVTTDRNANAGNVTNAGIHAHSRSPPGAETARYRDHPALLAVTVYMALAYCVGQVTNVLLPAFVQLQRGGSSIEYAALEMSWAGGALLACLLLTRLRFSTRAPVAAGLAGTAVLACLLGAVPLLNSIMQLAIAHCVLGIFFSTVRVVGETQFLSACPMTGLARFRANMNLVTQGSALLAFSVPLIGRQAGLAAHYWAAAGVIMATLACASIAYLRAAARKGEA
jgi:MFS family permease